MNFPHLSRDEGDDGDGDGEHSIISPGGTRPGRSRGPRVKRSWKRFTPSSTGRSRGASSGRRNGKGGGRERERERIGGRREGESGTRRRERIKTRAGKSRACRPDPRVGRRCRAKCRARRRPQASSRPSRGREMLPDWASVTLNAVKRRETRQSARWFASTAPLCASAFYGRARGWGKHRGVHIGAVLITIYFDTIDSIGAPITRDFLPLPVIFLYCIIYIYDVKLYITK